MIRQRYIVCLGERDGKQIWLAYDSMGRIGNADCEQAWRYETINAAFHALAKVRRERRWPDAEIFGTTVDLSDE